MYIIYRPKPDCTPCAVSENWRDVIVQIRNSLTPVDQKNDVFYKKITFSNCSRVQHVYGNIYAGFDSFDKQCFIKIIEPKDRDEVAALGEDIPHAPDTDSNEIESMEFSNGFTAKWEEDKENGQK